MKKQKLGCYAGLDLSLAGTGGVLLDDQGEVVSVLAFSTSKREAAASGKNSRTHILLSPEVKMEGVDHIGYPKCLAKYNS